MEIRLEASTPERGPDSLSERAKPGLATHDLRRADQLSKVLATLADGNRRAIIEYLAQQDQKSAAELSISRIADSLLLTRFSASRHLRTLHEAGLVELSRSGAAKLSVLNIEPLLRVEDWIIAVTDTQDEPLDHGWEMRLTPQD